jgi:polypeptide N-acetylgalactosaminyltransferase
MCLDSQDVDDVDKPLIAFGCHGQGGNQFFLMSKRNEIRREEKCFDYAGGTTDLRQPKKVRSMTCHAMQGNQMWFYQVG